MVLHLSENQDFHVMALAAIDLCRSGDWAAGLPRLSFVAKYRHGDEPLPGVFYSYLGYGLAKRERKYQEGLDLCKIGVGLNEFDGEPWLYLAKTYMLFGRRKPAIGALDRGLQLDPEGRDLLKMRSEFGWRRPPVMSALPRGHTINRVAGGLRSLATPSGGTLR